MPRSNYKIATEIQNLNKKLLKMLRKYGGCKLKVNQVSQILDEKKMKTDKNHHFVLGSVSYKKTGKKVSLDVTVKKYLVSISPTFYIQLLRS